MKNKFTKEEIQLLIQILENVNLPVKQVIDFILPLRDKLLKMLLEEESQNGGENQTQN